MRAADIKANVQALSQACAQQMQADSELDPIRTKVQLIRTLTEGAPPPEILSNNSKPTSEERLAIARWAALADECAQQQMRYLLTLSLPPNSISGRDKLVLLLREANEQRGVLIAALYDGRLTYSEFAAERMKVGDQFVAALSGTASPRQATEQVVATPLNISPSPVGSSESQLREGNEVALERRGNSYLVPVAVNGLPPMGFILDTGADDVFLPAELDSSQQNCRPEESNNHEASGGQEIDDLLNGVVGAVVGGFEFAGWLVSGIWAVMEAAVGERSAQPFVEEEEEQCYLNSFWREAVGVAGAVAL